MGEYEISLARILPYKDRIYNSVLYGRIRISENPYSRLFYAVFGWFRQSLFLYRPKLCLKYLSMSKFMIMTTISMENLIQFGQA